MRAKTIERREATRLRKRGLSYAEISAQLGVAKSSLSLWLRDVAVPVKGQKRIARKISKNGKAAGSKSKSIWRHKREDLHTAAAQELSSLTFTNTAFAYVGAALYWAEGTKNLDLSFVNAYPEMLQLYVRWLHDVIGVRREELVCRVQVYLNNGLSLREVHRYWASLLGIPTKQFTKAGVRNIMPSSSKKKRGTVHLYGVLRVSVKEPLRYSARLAVLLERMGKRPTYVELPSRFR